MKYCQFESTRRCGNERCPQDWRFHPKRQPAANRNWPAGSSPHVQPDAGGIEIIVLWEETLGEPDPATACFLGDRGKKHSHYDLPRVRFVTSCKNWHGLGRRKSPCRGTRQHSLWVSARKLAPGLIREIRN